MIAVSAEQMRKIDHSAIEEWGIPGSLLMENAGAASALCAGEMLREISGSQVTILCGAGNNGGDGYVCARHLLLTGAQVRVITLAKTKPGSDAEFFLKLALKCGAVQVDASDNEEMALRAITDCPPNLFVDAMLGTGINGPARPPYKKMIQAVNVSKASVLSLDIPSGASSDCASVEGPVVQANKTICFGLPKVSMYFSPVRELCGEISVVPIGFPPPLLKNIKNGVLIPDRHYVASRLSRPEMAAYKGTRGKVLLLAGSVGMTGAAELCSKSAMKSGAGLAILSCREEIQPTLDSRLTEVMTMPLDEDPTKAAHSLFEKFDWATAAGAGPGLGRDDWAGQVLSELIKSRLPLILDADALDSSIAGSVSKRKAPTVLTPHPGEYGRLDPHELPEAGVERFERLRHYSRMSNCVLHLKGAPSVTIAPDGRAAVNTTGNPGMASGGMGDVLTGIISTFLSQKMEAFDAAVCASWVHGRAADVAVRKTGMAGLTATDVLTEIGPVIAECVNQ